MAGDVKLRIEGLRDLRRNLRAVDAGAPRELQRVIKGAVSNVAAEAQRTAPRRSGALAASYRPFTQGNTAGVRSPLPYAGVIEWGGTIHPRHADILFRRRLVVTRAADRRMSEVVRDLDRGIGDLAGRHGWR